MNPLPAVTDKAVLVFLLSAPLTSGCVSGVTVATRPIDRNADANAVETDF